MGKPGMKRGQSVRTRMALRNMSKEKKFHPLSSGLEVWRVDRTSMCLGSGNCPKHAVDQSREWSTCQTQVSGRTTIVNSWQQLYPVIFAPRTTQCQVTTREDQHTC